MIPRYFFRCAPNYLPFKVLYQYPIFKNLTLRNMVVYLSMIPKNFVHFAPIYLPCKVLYQYPIFEKSHFKVCGGVPLHNTSVFRPLRFYLRIIRVLSQRSHFQKSHFKECPTISLHETSIFILTDSSSSKSFRYNIEEVIIY